MPARIEHFINHGGALVISYPVPNQHGKVEIWTQIVIPKNMAKRIYDGDVPTSAEAPGWVRDCLMRERELTVEYAGLYARDRLLFSNPTWDIVGIVTLCEPKRIIDRVKPFESKVAALDRALCIRRGSLVENCLA